MIARPDPDQLMAGPLGEWLTAQNADRAAARARVGRIRRTTVILIVVAAIAVAMPSGRLTTGLQVAFFIGAAGFAYAEYVKRPLLNRLKGGINSAVARALGLDYTVECVPGQTFARAQRFAMLPDHDTARFQDLWWGVIAGQPFTMHEARLQEHRGSGKNRRTVTVFEGQIMSIGFNRRFAATTLIEPDGERRSFVIGPERDSATIGGLMLDRIDITHPGFEDRFTVWSTDQVEARYIVHPEYVERLLAVEAAFAGTGIRALFAEGDLLIVLKTGDLFESGSLQPVDDRALLERAIDQFAALADLATTLNERARTIPPGGLPSSTGP